MVKYTLKRMEELNATLKRAIKKMQGGWVSKPKPATWQEIRMGFEHYFSQALEGRGTRLELIGRLSRELAARLREYSRQDNLSLLTLHQIQNAMDMLIYGEVKDFTDQEITDAVRNVGNPKWNPRDIK